jgi:hypothetical protein
MMKANDINPNGGPATPSPSTNPTTPVKKPKKDPKTPGKGSSAKKRKADEAGLGSSSAEDEDGAGLKPEGQEPPNSDRTPKARRVFRSTSAVNKLDPSLNKEDKPKVADPGLSTGGVFGGIYDGTTEVVDANPNWCYEFSEDGANGLNLPVTASMADLSVSFDAFVHPDHHLHATSSEFEDSLSLNPETSTTVGQEGENGRPIKTEAGSIFIEK